MLHIKYTVCLLNVSFALYLQSPVIVSIESVSLWGLFYTAEIPLASKAWDFFISFVLQTTKIKY